MECGLVTGDGEVVWSRRLPTAGGADAESLFAQVVELVDAAVAEVAGRSLTAVGVGCGGPMADGLVSPLNIPGWRRFPLAARLRQLPEIAPLGLPVALDNDAKALALGEAWLGKGRGEPGFVAMVVSTGIGGGLVVDGRLIDGAAGNAGHIGHVVVEPGGRPCACGARGCLEAEASGTAIEAITGAPASQAPPEVRERSAELVGVAVASVVNLLDIPLALVGGSVALGYGPSYFAAAQRALAEHARLDFSRGARIEPVGLGAAAGLVGAAAVGWRAAGLECPR